MKTLIYSFMTVALCSLIACGGGGGGGGASFNGITLSGVAATGAAISNGTVEAKCKTGNGSATSNADGSYQVKVSNGAGPCLLKAVDPTTNTALYSMVEQGSTTANINPVTHLVVANVLIDEPSTAFNQFSETVANKITADKINTGVTNIRAATAAIGTDADMSDVDFMKGSMKAATDSQAGDSTDKKIDALMASLIASDKKITDLATEIKSVTTTSGAAAKMNTVVGNAKNALDSSCPYVRSGKIWAFNIYGLDPEAYEVDFTPNSMKMTKVSNNQSFTISLKKDAADKIIPCAFTAEMNNESIEVRVSEGGIGAYAMSSSKMFGLTVPQQTNNLMKDENLAGTYPAMAFLNDSSNSLNGRLAIPMKFVINKVGEMKAYSCDTSQLNAAPECKDEVTGQGSNLGECSAQNGVYTCTFKNGATAKSVLYVTCNQATLFMSVKNLVLDNKTFNGLIVMTKMTPISLPSVGYEWEKGKEWEIGAYYGPNWTSNFYSDEYSAGEVLTVSPQTNSFTYSLNKDNNNIRTRYINTQNRFALTTKKDYKVIAFGSPTGWTLSAAEYTPANGGYDGKLKDFYIDIRAKR